MSINDVTPEDWDKVRKEHPAIVKESLDYKPYIDMAMQEAHALNEDMVNSPSHYTSTKSVDGKVECIEAIQESMSAEAFKGYCKGAVLKYLWRYERKDKSLEDLKKAQWYLNKLIEEVESE